jgi:hypothetical protein
MNVSLSEVTGEDKSNSPMVTFEEQITLERSGLIRNIFEPLDFITNPLSI